MKNILNQDQQRILKKMLSSYPQIVAGYLFGSRTKGTNTQESDLDMALVSQNKEGLSPIEIALRVEKIVKNYKTDVSILALDDSPLLLKEALNGKVIYEKNPVERVELETRILNFYEDFLAFRKVANYYLDKSFKEGVYANR